MKHDLPQKNLFNILNISPSKMSELQSAVKCLFLITEWQCDKHKNLRSMTCKNTSGQHFKTSVRVRCHDCTPSLKPTASEKAHCEAEVLGSGAASDCLPQAPQKLVWRAEALAPHVLMHQISDQLSCASSPSTSPCCAFRGTFVPMKKLDSLPGAVNHLRAGQHGAFRRADASGPFFVLMRSAVGWLAAARYQARLYRLRKQRNMIACGHMLQQSGRVSL